MVKWLGVVVQDAKLEKTPLSSLEIGDVAASIREVGTPAKRHRMGDITSADLRWTWSAPPGTSHKQGQPEGTTHTHHSARNRDMCYP